MERVLRDSDIEPRPGVAQVEEVDAVLDELAGRCRFSSLELRESECKSGRKRKRGGGPSQEQQRLSAAVPEEILRPIYLKLRSSEAKWLSRMVLKDFGPVVLDDEDATGRLVMRHIHFLMPSLLKFQDDLRAAVDLLNGPLNCYPPRTDPQSEKLHAASAATHLRPKVGLKVGNSAFDKARSIKHCVRMAGKSRWSVERKYDGEYCEIHIDLLKEKIPHSNIIKIFSKSGKESTEDRLGIHEILRKCLKLGQDGCPIEQKCILLAEMVAYSDKDKKIMEFHKIRKLVTRSGCRLGIAQDSQRHEYEHLMLVFFDVLLLDNEPLILKTQEERRQRLMELVKTADGQAIIAESSIINFSNADAPEILTEQFLSSVRSCHEGLVLKPCHSPYVNFAAFATGAGKEDHRTSLFEKKKFIKLKKDFIPGLGDTADLVVIGGSYDAQKSFQHRVPGLEFTSFYLACPEGTGDSNRGGVMCPTFKVVGVINESVCIPKPCMATLNDTARFMAVDYHPHQDNHSPDLANLPFNIVFAIPELSGSMQKVFTESIVCEVLGSGFEKPSGSNTYMLRHPRMLKVHTGPNADRSWADAVSFEELQNMAERSLRTRDSKDGEDGGDMEEEMQEMEALIERSMKGERCVGGQIVNSQDTITTSSTTTTAITFGEDAVMSQCWRLTDESKRLITREEADARKERSCSAEVNSAVRGSNVEKRNNSYDNIANKITEETQYYNAASFIRRNSLERSLPTPPTSSISSEGSSRQCTEKTNDSLQDDQIFQTPPLLLTSKVSLKISTEQELPGSEVEDELDESFHTPPTKTNCFDSTTTTTTTTTAAAVTTAQSCIDDKPDVIKARSSSNPKKRKQPTSDLRSTPDDRLRPDFISPASQPKGIVRLNILSEKAYDPFAKVLSSVKSGIKSSGFGFEGVTSHDCHARDDDSYDRRKHQHQPHWGKMDTDRVDEEDGNDGVYSSSRRRSGMAKEDIARSSRNDNILNINNTTNHPDIKIFKDKISQPSNHSLTLTKSARWDDLHLHHHQHYSIDKNKTNKHTCKPTTLRRTSSSSTSSTWRCLCLDSSSSSSPPPILNLQDTTIHLSTSSLTPNRRSQLKTLLTRKHGSAIVIDNLKYWSRQHSEAASGSGSGSESNDDDDDKDDQVVPESQSHPGLTKVVLVDAAAAAAAAANSSLSSSSSSSPPPPPPPPPRCPERIIRPVVKELGRAGISSNGSSSKNTREEDSVCIWDWRVLRGLMGGGGAATTVAKDGKNNDNANNDNNNNNNNNNNKSNNKVDSNISKYYIGKLVFSACLPQHAGKRKGQEKVEGSTSLPSSIIRSMYLERA